MSKPELSTASEAGDALASIDESQRKVLMRTVLPWWGDVLAAAVFGLVMALISLKVFENLLFSLLLVGISSLLSFLWKRHIGVKLPRSKEITLLFTLPVLVLFFGSYKIGRWVVPAYGDHYAWLVGLAAALGMLVVACGYRFYIKRRAV